MLCLTAAFAVLLLVLTGCNKAKTPREAVELFVVNMNNHEYKAAFAYVSEYGGIDFSSDREATQSMLDAVSSSLKVEITSDSTNTYSAMLSAKVTTVDLRLIYKAATIKTMNSLYTQAVSGNQISDAEIRNRIMAEIVAMAMGSDAPMVTTEYTFNLKSEGGKWYIVLDSVGYNIITGYLTEANTLVQNGEILSFEAGDETPADGGEGGDETPDDGGDTLSESDAE
jgi:hypothetical protein